MKYHSLPFSTDQAAWLLLGNKLPSIKHSSVVTWLLVNFINKLFLHNQESELTETWPALLSKGGEKVLS